MGEYPRGWTYTATANGAGTAAVTVPGVPGVAHVLDTLTAGLRAYGAMAGAFGPLAVQVQSPAGTTLYQSALLVVEGTAGQVDRDDFSISTVDLQTIPGAALVATFNGPAVANGLENLTIQGHDI